jgi:hypothetical protein
VRRRSVKVIIIAIAVGVLVVAPAHALGHHLGSLAVEHAPHPELVAQGHTELLLDALTRQATLRGSSSCQFKNESIIF